MLILGTPYFISKQKAIEYYRESLKIDREMKDNMGIVTTLNKIGSAYSNWGNYDQALSPLNERSEERRVGKECRSRWSTYH